MTECVHHAMAIQWFFARQSTALVGLTSTTLEGRLGNQSIFLVAIIPACVLSHSSIGLNCTNPFYPSQLAQLVLILASSSFSSPRLPALEYFLPSCSSHLIPHHRRSWVFWQIIDGEYQYWLGVIADYLPLRRRDTIHKPVGKGGL